MKSWKDFSLEEPELANYGKLMLLQKQGRVGLGSLATLLKDGAPRLHLVSLVFSRDHLFMFIPPKSPKCGDLKRDGRYALQAFPQPEKELAQNSTFLGLHNALRTQQPFRPSSAKPGFMWRNRSSCLSYFWTELCLLPWLIEVNRGSIHPISSGIHPKGCVFDDGSQ
jgi:hypothetical protein